MRPATRLRRNLPLEPPRFLLGWRGLVIALVLLASLLLPAAPVQAQTASKLVSNTGQTDAAFNGSIAGDVAQAFTTGSDPGGYRLTKVQFHLRRISTESPFYTVSIHSDSSNSPGTSLGTLTKPSLSTTAGLHDFTASGSGISLSPNTTYWVVWDVSDQNSSSGNIHLTASNAEDSGAATGWSIANTGRWRNFDATTWTSSNNARKIAVHGTTAPTNRAPRFTGSHGTTNAPVGTLVSLDMSESDFVDDDGDTLTFSIDWGREGLVDLGSSSWNKSVGRVFFSHKSASDLACLAVTSPFNTIVTVTATDPGGLTATGRLTFRSDDSLPACTQSVPTLQEAIPDRLARQGKAFSYTVPSYTFSDPDPNDDDALTYSARLANGHLLPSWLTFDAATRTFSGTPWNRGTTSVRVIGRAGATAATDTFDITVVSETALEPPTLSNATMDGTEVRLEFAGPALQCTGRGASPGAFTIDVAGFASWVRGWRADVIGARCESRAVVLRTSQSLNDAGAVTVSYDRWRGSPALVSVNDVYVENFTGRPVTRSVAGPPTLQNAAVNGRKLTLTFNEYLDANSVPWTGRFHVTVGDARRHVASRGVAIDGTDVTLTLRSAVAPGETVKVRYTAATTFLRDTDRQNVATFGDQAVTNATAPVSVTDVSVTSDSGADRTYGYPDTIEVGVTFSEPVSVTGAPRLKIRMDSGGGETWAVYAGGSGLDAGGSGTRTLTFARAVASPDLSARGIALPANTLELNGGAIRTVAGDIAAPLAHGGKPHDPAHKVDWRAESDTQGASADDLAPDPDAAAVTGVEVVSDPGANDTYGLGDTIAVRVTFDGPVSVTGTPRLKIDMDPADWGAKWASYADGGGTAGLTFIHTVGEPNLSTQGIAVLANTLEANGGTVRADGTDANLAHDGLGHDAAHKVDWRTQPENGGDAPPAVTGMSVVSDAGGDDTYALGNAIEVRVTFSEAVAVDTEDGTPRLKLDLGGEDGAGERWASYASGSGTQSLTFAWTAAAADEAAGGVAVLADTLEANGGTVKSAASDAGASLSHAGLPPDPAHKVDAVAPRLVRGEVDDATMTLFFSEALDPGAAGGRFFVDLAAETPMLGFAPTGPVTVAGTAVTVGLGEGNRRAVAGLMSGNVVLYARRADGGGGALRDLAGNPVLTSAVLPHHPDDEWRGSEEWRFVKIELDNVTPAPAAAPAVTGVSVVSDAGGDDTYGPGDVISIAVTFSEAVTVTGTPQINIDMDPADWGTKQAAYASGSGTTTLTFTHTVVEPNYSTQGIAVLANTLALNGGTIRSAGGENAALGHTGLAHDSNHKVDWRLPPSQSSMDCPACSR